MTLIDVADPTVNQLDDRSRNCRPTPARLSSQPGIYDYLRNLKQTNTYRWKALIAAYTLIPFTFFYAALSLWMTAGDQAGRAFCMVMLGLWVAVDAALWSDCNKWVAVALLLIWAIICICASSVVNGWWQFVVVAGFALHYILRRLPPSRTLYCCCGCWYPCCCGWRSRRRMRKGAVISVPASSPGPAETQQPLSVDASKANFNRSGGDNKGGRGAHPHHQHRSSASSASSSSSRGSACFTVVMRGFEMATLTLLLPAITSQSGRYQCFPSSTGAGAADGSQVIPIADRVVRMDLYVIQADSSVATSKPPGVTGTGEGRDWKPLSDGNLLLRTPTDYNATYAIVNHNDRSIYFAGTHTWAMIVADFDTYPVEVQYDSRIRLQSLDTSSGLMIDGNATADPCGSVIVSRGFWTVYLAVRDQVLPHVAAMLARNGSQRIMIGGFSLGGAVAPLAALDLVCSGMVAPSQVLLVSMAGPAAGPPTTMGTLDMLQSIGMTTWRILSTFDIVPWLPALLYDHMRTPHTYLTYTQRGQFVMTAHGRRGYLPSYVSDAVGMEPCAQLRALAFVPVLISLMCWMLVAAARHKYISTAGKGTQAAEGQGGVDASTHDGGLELAVLPSSTAGSSVATASGPSSTLVV